MASGDVADGICHSNDHESECECGSEIPAGVFTADYRCYTAGKQDKDECADEFCQVFSE